MKKNKKIVILLLTILSASLLTGCTTYLKDSDNKTVTNPETGQSLPSNILCQPTSESTLKAYTDYREQSLAALQVKLDNEEITKEEYDQSASKVLDVSTLPSCTTFKITDGNEGLWETIFVKPLAWCLIRLGELCHSYGLAIIIVTLIIRLATITLSKKSMQQSEQMKKAQPALDKIEFKYRGREDQDSMIQKNQETLAVYKKNNINPLSGCLFALIQIPLFFAFYEAMSRLPALFEETFLGFQMGTTPIVALGNGQYQYILCILLVLATSFFSLKMSSQASATGDQAKQMKMMTNVSVVMISIASISLSTAIAIYWITNSSFTIFQNLIIKWRKKNAK